MPQNLLQNEHAETILDLRGLAEPDLLIIDRSGREWPIPADLPLRAALELQRQALSAASSSSADAGALEGQVDGLLIILRLRQPALTREDVLDAFSLGEAQRLVEWISFRLAGQAQTNGSQPGSPSAQPSATQNRRERRAATRTQNISPRASDVAT